MLASRGPRTLGLLLISGLCLTHAGALHADYALDKRRMPTAAAETAAILELGSWRTTQLASITVYSNAPEKALLRAVLGARAFLEVVSALVLGGELAALRPAEIFLFARGEQFHRFEVEGIGGHTVSGDDGLILGLGLERHGVETLILYHELVHLVLASDAGGHYPAWFSEGLAELLGPTLIRSDVAAIGAMSLMRTRMLAHYEPLPLTSLLSSGTAFLSSHEETLRYYADAWAFVHYGVMSHGTGGPRRSHHLMRFVTALRAGEAWRPALERSFEAPLDVVEGEYRRHRKRLVDAPTHPNVHVTPRPPGPQPVLQSVAPEQIARRLAAYALQLGSRRAELAGRLFDFVLASEPDDPDALLGRIDVASMTADFDRAASLWTQLPHDARESVPGWETFARLAHARYASLDREDRLRLGGGWLMLARDGYRRVLADRPERFTALAAFGETYLLEPEGDVGPGIEALERAARAHPQVAGLRLELGQLYIRSGDFHQARPHLRYVVDAHPDSKDARLAKHLLRQCDRSLAED